MWLEEGLLGGKKPFDFWLQQPGVPAGVVAALVVAAARANVPLPREDSMASCTSWPLALSFPSGLLWALQQSFSLTPCIHFFSILSD